MKNPTHKQGTPCSIHLGSRDIQTAKAFYAQILDWTYQDIQPEHGQTPYSKAIIDDLHVADIYTQTEQERDSGVPPSWGISLLIHDITRTVAKATELGATIITQPMQIHDRGHMAVIKDPTDATFALWQPINHIGIEAKHRHGAMESVVCLTTDDTAATDFYRKLLEIESASHTSPWGAHYFTLRIDGKDIASIVQPPDELIEQGIASNWQPYFRVDDVDAATQRALEHGAEAIEMPWDDQLPDGTKARFSYLKDPEGAEFGLATPETD